MTGERVAIQYDIAGAAQGAEQVTRLKASMDGVGQSAQQSAPAIDGLERSLQQANRGAVQAEQGFNLFGQQSRQIATHVQGLGGIVANLSGQLSGQGGAVGQAGHLVGALAGVASQSLALGAVMGPGGAVVGALVGLIPLIMDLANADAHAATEAREHAAAITSMATAAQSAIRDLQSLHNLQAGGELALGDRADSALVADTHRALATMQDLETQLSTAQHTIDAAGAHALARHGQGAALEAQVASLREQEAAQRAILENIHAEQDRRVQVQQQLEQQTPQARALAAVTSEEAVATRAVATARSAATHAAREHAAVAITLAQSAQAEQRFIAEMTSHATTTRTTQAAPDSLIAGLAAGSPERQEQQRLAQQAEERAVQRSFAIKTQAALAQAQQEERNHQTRMRHEQEFSTALQGTGATFGAVFGQAFTAAITGQENFGAAMLRGSKQVLLQLGERYIAEGSGALLEALGFAFTNPPAAGAKAIEGGGKIALGVGLGAAGAAISVPSAPAAAAPSASSSQMGSGGNKGQAPIVINMNSPSVIGGTTQQWGRMAASSIQSAQLRYGGR